jgi:hypothetical protein
MKYLKLFEDYQNISEDTFHYMLLNRLQTDCEYFLGYGNGSENRLWSGSIETIIQKMKELWEQLPVKPEWLSYEQIEEYERKMLDLRENPKKYYDNPDSIIPE